MTGDHIGAIILAAGASSRMGGIKKEFQKLKNGGTVLGSSVRVFASVPAVKTIVIAVNEAEEENARNALPKDVSAQDTRIHFVKGGSTRRASVYNALSYPALKDACYVLIHDGARPWVSVRLVNNLIEAVKKYDAVIPVLAITETPKELGQDEGGDFFVQRHLKRANVGAAQTPQCFKYARILRAHEEAVKVSDEEFTDDAEIWGRFSGKVACIPGEAENKKITFPEDLN